MKKIPHVERQKKNQLNKKALVWVGAMISVILIVMTTLIILNK